VLGGQVCWATGKAIMIAQATLFGLDHRSGANHECHPFARHKQLACRGYSSRVKKLSLALDPIFR